MEWLASVWSWAGSAALVEQHTLGGCSNTSLSLANLEAGSPRQGAGRFGIWGMGFTSWFRDNVLLQWEGWGSFWSPCFRGNNPTHEGSPPHDLTAPQRPHPLTSSHRASGFNIWTWGTRHSSLGSQRERLGELQSTPFGAWGWWQDTAGTAYRQSVNPLIPTIISIDISAPRTLDSASSLPGSFLSSVRPMELATATSHLNYTPKHTDPSLVCP